MNGYISEWGVYNFSHIAMIIIRSNLSVNKTVFSVNGQWGEWGVYNFSHIAMTIIHSNLSVNNPVFQ